MFASWTYGCSLPVASSAIIVVSASFEALSLNIVKNKFNFHRSNTTGALLMTTYSALLFFLSATLSGIILMRRFGEFPVWAPWKSDSIQLRYGSKGPWIWVVRHYVLSVIAGTISVIAQVVLFGWLEESTFVKGGLSVVVAIGVLFLAYLVRLLLRD